MLLLVLDVELVDTFPSSMRGGCGGPPLCDSWAAHIGMETDKAAVDFVHAIQLNVMPAGLMREPIQLDRCLACFWVGFAIV